MKFKIAKKQVKPGFFKKVVIEEPSSISLNKKGKMRYRVNNEVFDIHDSVADNAKMISLIFALLSRIWEEAIPNEIKDKMDKETREMIEYAFNKYHSIQTRADVEFLINGKELIDKLMDRQDKIGKLFKEIYGIKGSK